MPNRRLIRPLLALFLGGLLALMAPMAPAWSQFQPAPLATPLAAPRAIPISEQPFYPELQATAARWADAPLGQVVGDSPRDTLLNFYAVMARVYANIEQLKGQAKSDPGLLWSPAAHQRIDATDQLFSLAVQALDAREFPQSVREDMAHEAALQLKQVLDYVFTHSIEPITIPDGQQLKELNAQRSQPSQSWTLLDTAITLVLERQASDGNPGFVFSSGTVSQIRRMYDQIAATPALDQPFVSPNFYEGFSSSPGYLTPPKWYLRLPIKLRQMLEISFYGQTLLQISAALLVLLLYFVLLRKLAKLLLHTFRSWQAPSRSRLSGWQLDNLAWYRVLLLLPVLPLTRFSQLFLDDYVNFTGLPLVIITYLFFIAYFIAASFFCFYLFEALSRSISEVMARLRGGGSELQLRRASNLVMPVGRVCGGLLVLALIYHLLISLGLPSSTVLAFSAVPGLAIGLGASKLLGNLFAGLSIQTDRPVRVGEFCRIGDNLGFVTKIGLRSLELQTLESRITIPNSIADEQTIVNYSRRSPGSSAAPMQSLDIHLGIEQRLSPEQVDDLLAIVRAHVAAVPELLQPLVSLEQSDVDQLTLICFAMVSLHDWPTYLSVREQLLCRLQQLVEQVRLSTFTIGVSYDTRSDQLERLPALIQGVVNSDPLFDLQSCRLMVIADFSYNIVVRLHGHQDSLRAFKDAIHALNQRLLVCFAQEGIEIPFPTQLQLQRDV
ncbi:MAG: hypothetical protein RLZZ263_220 [Cyanobacteriota bacterium]